jgi:hypothetical protein
LMIPLEIRGMGQFGLQTDPLEEMLWVA